MKKLMLTALVYAYCLTGCAKAEPRSTDYFADHLDEGRQMVASCRDGIVRGEECANAATAVEEADAKERFRRFRGRD